MSTNPQLIRIHQILTDERDDFTYPHLAEDTPIVCLREDASGSLWAVGPLLVALDHIGPHHYQDATMLLVTFAQGEDGRTINPCWLIDAQGALVGYYEA